LWRLQINIAKIIFVFNCKTLSRLLEQGVILRREILSTVQQHNAGKIPQKSVRNDKLMFLYFLKNGYFFDLDME